MGAGKKIMSDGMSRSVRDVESDEAREIREAGEVDRRDPDLLVEFGDLEEHFAQARAEFDAIYDATYDVEQQLMEVNVRAAASTLRGAKSDRGTGGAVLSFLLTAVEDASAARKARDLDLIYRSFQAASDPHRRQVDQRIAATFELKTRCPTLTGSSAHGVPAGRTQPTAESTSRLARFVRHIGALIPAILVGSVPIVGGALATVLTSSLSSIPTFLVGGVFGMLAVAYFARFRSMTTTGKHSAARRANTPGADDSIFRALWVDPRPWVQLFVWPAPARSTTKDRASRAKIDEFANPL